MHVMLAMLQGLVPQLRCRPDVIICPAQFGVPKDYDSLREQLLARGHERVVVAPLRRFDWLRIVPSIATTEFWTSKLEPTPTLEFYYQALDEAFETLENSDRDVALVGHSIGGWICRAYIGERGKRVSSVVTLGTPHNPPPASTAIDQTRGLLDYVNANFKLVDGATCVVGNSTTAGSLEDLLAKPLWDSAKNRSPLLESLVALPSYAVLAATLDPFRVRGDGLIPIDAALLPGCESIVIDDCHHSGFIPTALDSIVLPSTYEWYGSPDKVSVWADALV
ncbi:hypothetical protein CTAYLR_010314 [Chrysophaeum taylorii]|uniref:AB hydrolase-1 domain-containing protein n=1 Tax=Chrysophaeum taylorii TaxID=2483200 RepID=A0AAD7UJ54_9STRA|nr:hypothetical protein CTAYLR_010314 [Chrysophaeum taylorii]